MANCAAIAAAASAVPTIASDNGSGELTARASLLFLPLSIPPSLLPFLWRPSSVSSESWACFGDDWPLEGQRWSDDQSSILLIATAASAVPVIVSQCIRMLGRMCAMNGLGSRRCA